MLLMTNSYINTLSKESIVHPALIIINTNEPFTIDTVITASIINLAYNTGLWYSAQSITDWEPVMMVDVVLNPSYYTPEWLKANHAYAIDPKLEAGERSFPYYTTAWDTFHTQIYPNLLPFPISPDDQPALDKATGLIRTRLDDWAKLLVRHEELLCFQSRYPLYTQLVLGVQFVVPWLRLKIGEVLQEVDNLRPIPKDGVKTIWKAPLDHHAAV